MSPATQSEAASDDNQRLSENPVQGVIIVDHGSRRDASNQMLHAAAASFALDGIYPIVEPAHMELAEPDIATAFRRCVERGAEQVIVFPYFLSPGRHWQQDIPQLVAAAAANYPGVSWIVTAPFGLHPDMNGIIRDRIQHCLADAANRDPSTRSRCDSCKDSAACQLHAD